MYDKNMKNLLRKKTKILKNPISGSAELFVFAEKMHIQAHLAFTELRLRTKKSNTDNYPQRLSALNVLHNYWVEGVFPKNTYESNKRKPVFIDNNGTYCAVGYLMANTGYSELANDIDKKNKFALVEDINDSNVDTWLNDFGLTKNEAALIQPGYGGFVIERVSYSLQDKVMAVLSILASIAVVILVIVILRLMRNKTVPSVNKRRKLLLSGAGITAIIVGFVFFLPLPTTTVQYLTNSSQDHETIACEGWNTPKNQRPSVCNEFEEKGSVPGWRKAEVPCEGICLL